MVLVKTSPILLFGGDFITSSFSVPLGVEFHINKKLSFEQNFSYIFPVNNSGLLAIDVDKIKGIRTDSEIKRYLNSRNNFTGFYFSSHFLYQYTDAILKYYEHPPEVYRNLFALHQKIGWQCISKRGFVFNVAIGIGTRYSISKTSKAYEQDGGDQEFSPFYWYDKPYEYGHKWFFSVNGTFALGWQIDFSKKD